MAVTQSWFEVSFGSSKSGIGTVGYRLYQDDGTDSVARTTSGVIEIGNGVYGVPNVSVPDDAVGIEWDTGGGSPVYAVEDIQPYRDRISIATSKDVYQGAVYLNTTGAGTSGTDYPTGTFFQPSDNLSDALTISSANNINQLNVTGDLTLSQSIAGYVIEGGGNREEDIITLNSQNTTGTIFRNCGISGAQNGKFFAERCRIGNMTNINFSGENLVLTGTSYQMMVGGILEIYRGTGVDVTSGLTFDFNAASIIKLDKFNAVMILTNMNNIAAGIAHIGNSDITIQNTCIQGFCITYGISTITNNASGNPSMVVDTTILPNDVLEVVVDDHETVGTLGEVIKWMAARGAGKYEIDDANNQIYWTKPDGTTEAVRFNTFDEDGNPAVTNVYKREKV